MSYIKLSDAQLTQLIIDGDKLAFTEIYNRYWPVMYTHAFKFFGNQDDARDVLQELFTTLWLKNAELNIQTNLSGFLYITLRNKCLDFIQKNKTKNNHLQSLTNYIEINQNNIVEEITEKEILRILDEEIENLPPKMKIIFQLRLKEHKSYAEIAEILNISDKTVKKQINNALKIIKPKFKGYHYLSFLLFLIKYF